MVQLQLDAGAGLASDRIGDATSNCDEVGRLGGDGEDEKVVQ